MSMTAEEMERLKRNNDSLANEMKQIELMEQQYQEQLAKYNSPRGKFKRNLKKDVICFFPRLLAMVMRMAAVACNIIYHFAFIGIPFGLYGAWGVYKLVKAGTRLQDLVNTGSFATAAFLLGVPIAGMILTNVFAYIADEISIRI